MHTGTNRLLPLRLAGGHRFSVVIQPVWLVQPRASSGCPMTGVRAGLVLGSPLFYNWVLKLLLFPCTHLTIRTVILHFKQYLGLNEDKPIF